MKVLRFIQKWLCKLWGSADRHLPEGILRTAEGVSLSTGIDSHKWESKIEILGHLSRLSDVRSGPSTL